MDVAVGSGVGVGVATGFEVGVAVGRGVSVGSKTGVGGNASRTAVLLIGVDMGVGVKAATPATGAVGWGTAQPAQATDNASATDKTGSFAMSSPAAVSFYLWPSLFSGLPNKSNVLPLAGHPF